MRGFGSQQLQCLLQWCGLRLIRLQMDELRKQIRQRLTIGPIECEFTADHRSCGASSSKMNRGSGCGLNYRFDIVSTAPGMIAEGVCPALCKETKAVTACEREGLRISFHR